MTFTASFSGHADTIELEHKIVEVVGKALDELRKEAGVVISNSWFSGQHTATELHTKEAPAEEAAAPVAAEPDPDVSADHGAAEPEAAGSPDDGAASQASTT